MAIAETPVTGLWDRVSSYVEWGPIIAGAVAAAAISFILLTFGSAIGLTAVSPWLNSALPVWLIALIAALWVLVVQAGSYALGGYLAGRLRAPVGGATSSERQFRDGAHGFLVWAVGAVITAIILALTTVATVQTGASAAATITSGLSQGTAAASGMIAKANDPVAYAIDRLLRPFSATGGTSGSAAATPAIGNAPTAENSIFDQTARIFASALGSGSLPSEDRAYLASQVAAMSAIAQPEAEKRVDQAFATVKDAYVKGREAADQTRRAASIAGFLAAAAMLIAAAAAAAGAGLGGAHRDESLTLRMFGRDRLW